MHSAFKMMALAGVAGLLSAAPASAEGFVPTAVCGGGSFSTCAAARVTVSGPDLSVRTWHPRGAPSSWGEAETSSTVSFDDGQHSPWAGKDRKRDHRDRNEISMTGCWSDERITGRSRERIECPSVVVTPEPISMTLMATGLAGMSGMGWMRRRRQSRQQ